jgi:hypothetical protein
VPYAAGMFSSQVTLLAAGFLLVIGAGGFWFFWVRRRGAKGELLPDARVSTLVFPPESKFQASAFPRQ